MDKYEYKLKLDEMKSLVGQGDYEKAEEIADTINWRKVKNVNSLVLASEIYSHMQRYEDSRDVLLMAYDRSPIGRTIIYRLAELAIHTHNFDEAKDYYEEFVEIAPHDNLKYVLRYELSREQGEPITEQIAILEELKEQEYTEKWAFELAELYHRAGMSDQCIDACDELVLWFGDGIYVEKALELKMLYQPLTPQQEEKYRNITREKIEREGVMEVRQDEDLASGEIVAETVQIPKVKTNTEKFNTVNLQKELAKSMQQIMDATEKETVSDTMDNIKKMVEDIPYLQMPREETQEERERQEKKYGHIETDEEIDGSLKINFQEMLGEEPGGQMNLNVPDRAMIERQITGQMSISDVLGEWEKTKRAAEAAMQEAEKRRLEAARKKALKETEEIMDRLKDIVPELEAAHTSFQTGTPVEEEAAGQIVANMNQILQQKIDKVKNTTEDLDEILKQKKEETRESREEQLKKKMVQPTKRIPSLEEFMKRTFFHDDDLLDEDLEEPEKTGDPEDFNENHMEESEIAEAEMNEPEETEEPETDEVPEEVFEETETAEPDLEGMDQKLEQALVTEYTDGELDEESDEEELEIEEYETEETAEEVPEEAPKKLTPEIKKLFTYFMPVNGMEEQVAKALFGCIRPLKKENGFGHILIQGIRGSGKTVLATNLIKALQKETGRPNGRIGKIEGKSLNQKDIAMLLRKVAGGCLIIESAGDISRETAVRLSLCLESDASDILIIMEDTKEGLRKALGRDEKFAERFKEKIVIPIFTSDELVAFAKVYANELGYDIDEMATLALYNRISNIQRLDEPTNLTEVKEIVDEAVARAEKVGFKKMFDIITSRRYTEDDYIALREKDFDE